MNNQNTQKIFLEECSDGLVGMFDEKIEELEKECQRIKKLSETENDYSLGYSLLSSIINEHKKKIIRYAWLKKRITIYNKEKLNKNIDANELIKNIDIVDFIGGYTKLNNFGKEFRGLCPFHNEKTPSFFVNKNKGVYHCFGCGQGGNVITFVIKMEGMSFRDALTYLNKY